VVVTAVPEKAVMDNIMNIELVEKRIAVLL
jgi:hypothetical protein